MKQGSARSAVLALRALLSAGRRGLLGPAPPGGEKKGGDHFLRLLPRLPFSFQVR